MLVSVSVFLKGDELVPKEISSALSVDPTESQTRGDTWTSPNGKTYARSTGVWIWGTKEDSDSATVADGVNRLWRQFQAATGRFQSLPGVEFSWVDIFVCDVSHGGSCEVKFTLPPETLRELGEIGLPVELTAGTVESE
jgi:hypothetical protein